MPENADTKQYTIALSKAFKAIKRFKPDYLVVLLGLDTAKGDPTGTWLLKSADFERNGREIGKLKTPTLVVQEGGYNTKSIGVNASAFFKGLWEGFYLSDTSYTE